MVPTRATPSLLDRWIPAGLPEDERTRALVFVSVAIAALSFSVFSVGVAVVARQPVVIAVNAFDAGLSLATLALYKHLRRRSLLVHVVLGAFTLATLAAALAVRPFDYSALAFLLIIPLAAATILGLRATWGWMAAVATAGIGAIVAGHRGYTLGAADPSPAFTQSMNLVFLLVGCVTFVLVFWHEKERTLVRMREAEAAQRRFFANVGHDLRTPMNGVLGLADALVDEPLSDHQREMVEAIRSSGSVLVGLLNDLLDLSKADAGRMQLHPTPLVLEAFVAELRGLWGPAAQRKGLELSVAADPSLPAAISVDGVRLRQVLNNLVANALKFTERGRVQVRLGRAGADLELIVTDTGPGIAPDQQARLFQPFAHADDERTRAQQGAGLGLAVSALLCSTMGGHLTLSSVRGQGSSFRAVVPLIEAPVPQAAEEPKEAPLPRGLRVLVVDDNSINRLVARRLFEARGCVVSEAPCGEAALALVLPMGFDLVLMDLSMPGLDGLATTRELRGRGYRGLVVGLSASVAEEARQNCLGAGMDDALPKPLRAEAVRGLLAGVGARQRPAA